MATREPTGDAEAKGDTEEAATSDEAAAAPGEAPSDGGADVDDEGEDDAYDDEDDAPRGKPSLLKRIVTPLIVLFVMLVIVELFLWIAMPLPISDRLYWLADGHTKARLEPNQEIVNEAGNDVAINALGFRGPDVAWTPAPGTLRIVALGGSSTFCYQVSADDRTWPAQLQRLLTDKLGAPVEVVNLALPGYDTSNSKVHYLFSGRALNPHVVLAYHTWNDMKFFRPLDEAGDATPRDVLSGRASVGNNPSAVTRFLRELQIARRLKKIANDMSADKRENAYTSLEQEGERAGRPVSERTWRWFAQNFRDLARFAKGDEVLPVLISQATLAKAELIDEPAARRVINNDFVGMTLPRLVAAYEKATRTIARVAEEEGAIYVDGYAAVPADARHIKDHVHLWDAGAEKLAQAVADGLMGDARFMDVARRVQAQGAPAAP